jgi:N-acetylmuramoyl-L-alanine amidase
VRRIVLDPGHGGENLGTRTPGGLEEKFLTLDIARRVREVLEAASFEVVMTREGDEAMTLEERAEVANRRRGDIFVSIHVNWFEGNRDSGIETYYLGPTDDPFLTRLAANENSHSGHTMAEMRDLLDGIYAGVRLDKSQDLAREIHQALYRSLSRVNPQLRDRGVKTAPFIVLVDTEMPAVLAEVAALSSQAEAAMLEKSLYREYIADSLAAGIIAYAQAVGGTPAQKGS